jgi:hypothetical protein
MAGRIARCRQGLYLILTDHDAALLQRTNPDARLCCRAFAMNLRILPAWSGTRKQAAGSNFTRTQPVDPNTSLPDLSPDLAELRRTVTNCAVGVQVVLTREDGTLKMSVYRASTSPDALGMFSREDFVRTPQGLKRQGKADVKFLRPEIPRDAESKMIDDVEVNTMTEMSEEEERQLRTDLAEMLRGVDGR